MRIVYLLLQHQKLPSINYDGFDPGTGHSTRALQGLMDRLKKQFITDAKDDDGAKSVATPAATPKKRGRAPAKKSAGDAKKATDDDGGEGKSGTEVQFLP